MATSKPLQEDLFKKTRAITRSQISASKRKANNPINDFQPTKRQHYEGPTGLENAVHLVKVKMTTTDMLNKKFAVRPLSNVKAAVGKPKTAVRKPLADQKNVFQVLPKDQEIKTVIKKEQPVEKQLDNIELPIDIQCTENNRRKSLIPISVKLKRKQPVQVQAPGVTTRKALARKSLELNHASPDTSLYVTALEDLNLDESIKPREPAKIKNRKPPPGVDDYDKEQLTDLGSAANYAMDIFEYMKSKESHFPVADYLPLQKDLNRGMRSVLVDWMVEVQDNFELNHESLYLAVKLVDLYLSHIIIKKEKLQLVGVASLFVASKFDERIPPVLDDFVEVCDNLYNRDHIMEMERKILRSIDYQLGIPISYRFLRRYARCGKYDMGLLTLARYILETNLMNYQIIRCSDSKTAASSLLIALNMKKQRWTKTLEYYSGYSAVELKELAFKINDYMHKPPSNLLSVRSKYSTESFYEVAKVPLIVNDKLNFTTV